MLQKIALIVAALAIVATMSVSGNAQQPDYGLCDGLKGAAWGMCAAGVSVGCDEDPTKSGCETLEQQYEAVLGTLPPWVEPPSTSTCPCDFNQISKALAPDGPWVGPEYFFFCPAFPNPGESDSVETVFQDSGGGLARLEAKVFYDVPESDDPGTMYCLIDQTDGTNLTQIYGLTYGEVLDCRQDIIDYGVAFKALYSEDYSVAVADSCTPTIP